MNAMMTCVPTTVTNRPVTRHDELAHHLDRFFNGLWPATAAGAVLTRAAVGSGAVPPINAWEDDATVVVEAELPGFKLADVDITWEDQTLTIRGRRGEEPVGEAGRYVRRERAVGEFSRTLRIADEIDPDQVRATLADGVLTVRLPKAAGARARKIEVTRGG